MDCPTIMVHAVKHYKARIDSGAAISLIRYSMYHTIDNSFKTPIQATMTKFNIADGSPMIALGMMTLQLRIADFQICSQLHHMQQTTRNGNTIWNQYPQKKCSLSYAWDKEKNCYIQKDGRFLTYTRNCEQKPATGIVKPALKIPPRHNDIIPDHDQRPYKQRTHGIHHQQPRFNKGDKIPT